MSGMDAPATRIEPTSARRDGRDNGLWIVAGLMALYSALHVGFRLLASWSLGEDDPIENILVQDLRWVYDPRQPPLYDWLLYAVQQVTGPTIVGFLAIKYTALIATGLLLYATARRAIGPGTLALMSVEGLALIYQLSWRFHEGYTHQVGTMVAVAATMWAALRVIDRQRTGDFLLLGLCAGLGILTQPIFALFLVSLLLAVAWEEEARRRLFELRLLIPAAVMAIAGGVFLWHAGAALMALVELPRLPTPRDALGGFLNALRAPLFYLSPLILIVPFLFPGVLGRMARDHVDALSARGPSGMAAEGAPGLFERIVLRTSLVGLVLSLAGATALGLKGHPSHAFMPLYITALVWLMGAVHRTRPSARSLTSFGRLALAIAAFALVARLANMFVLDPVCKICRWGIPYDGLATEIRTASPPRSVIATLDHELGGNLRAVLPDRRVVLVRGGAVGPFGAPPRNETVVLVWSATLGTAAAKAAFGTLVTEHIDFGASRLVRVPWRHTWRPTGYRASEWRVLVVAPRE